MRITSMRTKAGLVPSTELAFKVESELVKRLSKAGFITKVEALTRTSIKIGLHMKSFTIDTTKLGYNARVGMYVKAKNGYVRTSTPTWDQRVEFNHIVNDVLDKYKLSANIRSGKFEIRSKVEGRRDVDLWETQGSDSYSCDTGNYGASTNGFGQVISEIVQIETLEKE